MASEGSPPPPRSARTLRGAGLLRVCDLGALKAAAAAMKTASSFIEIEGPPVARWKKMLLTLRFPFLPWVVCFLSFFFSFFIPEKAARIGGRESGCLFLESVQLLEEGGGLLVAAASAVRGLGVRWRSPDEEWEHE